MRDGANIHAQAEVDRPPPLSLAQTMQGTAAALVLRAAKWSPQNHERFPSASRARAVEVLLTGHRLSRESHVEGRAVALVDEIGC